MQTQPNDVNSTYTLEANKSIAKVRFYDAQQRYGFINIDPAIIAKLNITSDTILTQEVTSEGILLRSFKEI